MSDDQFTKLFKYMQDFRQDVDEQLAELRKADANMIGAIGELSAQVRDYHNESILLSHQVDKLRDAIKQIAEETGIKLKVAL